MDRGTTSRSGVLGVLPHAVQIHIETENVDTRLISSISERSTPGSWASPTSEIPVPSHSDQELTTVSHTYPEPVAAESWGCWKSLLLMLRFERHACPLIFDML